MNNKPIKHKLNYSDSRFNHIRILIKEKKYFYAEEELLNYLNKYPKDVCAYLSYAMLLIINNRLEEADRVLNSKIVLEATIKEDISLAFYLKIKLLICKEKYLECYNFIKDNIDLFYQNSDDRDIEIMMFLKKKINILEDKREDIDSYFHEQLIEYKEGSFFSYMTKYITKKDNDSKAKFKENFPLREVYHKLREILPNENKLNIGTVVNYYLVKFDKCGTVLGKETNYFKVVTIANSNEITVMYPCENINRIPYIDLNLTYEEESIKVKTLSQVEKFNLRYNKKR